MSKHLKTLSKNTSSNVLFFICSKVLSLVQYTILIRYLDLSEYGLLIFARILLGQFNLLQGGLATSLVKFIPQFNVLQQREKINEAFSATFYFFLFIGFLISLLIIHLSSSDYLMGFFKISNSIESKNLLFIAGFFAPLIWSNICFQSALKGFNDFHYLNKIDLFFLSTTNFITIYLAINGFSILWIFLNTQIFFLVKGGFLLNRLINIFNLKFIFKPTKLIKIIKELFSYSIWVFVMEFASFLVTQFDKMIIAILLNVAVLPIYIGILELMKIFVLINGQLNSAVLPVASEIHAIQSSNTINKICIRGIQMVNSISVPIATLFIILAEPILQILGKDVLAEYVLLSQVGTVLFIITSSRSFLNNFLMSSEKFVKFLSFFSITTAICYLIVCIYAIEQFKVSGAILALPITHIILFPFWLFYIRKITGISIYTYILTVLKGQWPSILIIISYFSLFSSLKTNYNKLIMYFLISTIFLFISSWKFTIDKEVKSLIKDFTCSFFLQKKN